MPRGSNGFSSGRGRHSGGVVATVAGTLAGSMAGAPGRCAISMRLTGGLGPGCNSFGDGAGGGEPSGLPSGLTVMPAGAVSDAASLAVLAGLDALLDFGLRFLPVESNPVLPAAEAGREPNVW